jgi:hypothetical protein
MSRRLKRARGLLRRRLILRGLTLAIGILGLALVVSGMRGFVQRDRRASIAIRQEMASFRAPDGSDSIESALAAIAGGKPSRAVVLGRQAALVARRIEAHDPGENRDIWRECSGEMKLAGLQLAQAAEGADRFSMFAAARRLDASCLKCHEVFCSKGKNQMRGAIRGSLLPRVRARTIVEERSYDELHGACQSARESTGMVRDRSGRV